MTEGKNIGDNIREWASRMGMSVAEFCRRYKIKRRTLDLWLEGKRFPSLSQILNIETSLDYLIEGRHRPVYPYFVNPRKVSQEKARYYKKTYSSFARFLEAHMSLDEKIWCEVTSKSMEGRFLMEFLSYLFFHIYASLFTGTAPSFYLLMVLKWVAKNVANYDPKYLEEVLLRHFYPFLDSIPSHANVHADSESDMDMLSTIYRMSSAEEVTARIETDVTNSLIQFEDAVERSSLPLPCFVHGKVFWKECSECALNRKIAELYQNGKLNRDDVIKILKKGILSIEELEMKTFLDAHY